jgi:hypothetical protein
MTRERKSATVPILAALAIVLPFSLYFVGYFWLSSATNWSAHGIGYTDSVPPDLIVVQRAYPQHWLKTIYAPAGWVEGRLRGVDVKATHELESFDPIPSEPNDHLAELLNTSPVPVSPPARTSSLP